MLRFYFVLCFSLIVSSTFAKPCTILRRSCLKLNNHYSSVVKIECQWLDDVIAEANYQGSTQLDLSYGDGLGAPEPRQLNCKLRAGKSTRDLSFYNPYWGAVLEFNLIAEKQLEVRITDGWGSQTKSYSFTW